ncbi:hypothetical protein [Streptomyces hydrogenans]|uniref:hypothetical protein n=1 Tax=Streptomyces hydrogenans TaxID=1873719 RepID=UPI0036EF8965
MSATPFTPRRLELFRVRVQPRVVIDYARPDGGPLTEADYDHLARLARAASSLPLSAGEVTIRCP